MKRHRNTMVYLGMQPWPNLPCNQEMDVGMGLGGVGIMEMGWSSRGWDHGNGLVWMGSGSWKWVGVAGVGIMEMGWCRWGQDHGNGLVRMGELRDGGNRDRKTEGWQAPG